MGKIIMEHGSGGRATGELIREIFESQFHSDVLSEMEDAAVVPGDGTIAMTTDSFVVTPLEFPGGDIGRLCICGTVNDLCMRGAVPKYITCGFILEEGADIDTLRRIVKSMAETADEAGVKIVAGDTKVIEGNGGIYINTAGVGFVPKGVDIKAKNAEDDDVIIVSGNVGDHHATVLSQRMGIKNTIVSDNAPLQEMVGKLIENKIPVHVLRDVTRGGLATVLKELAVSSGLRFDLFEEKLPVDPQVQSFCGLLGLDPLYMGNEGKLVAIVPKEKAVEALELIRSCKYGENACMVGAVNLPEDDSEVGALIMKTEIGGRRFLDILQGEGLPRIC
ncbi:hydrogenase expression/formation protein HypE [Pseudobutyrivibrio sp.]|uniref:hydrogenase expression/formation protein HypE n=1 Tax=Pseudobutyrivibrio sp. TaxID=2014367 RepID=UPI001B7CA5A1|nr:hydrogenase expression/formation protein HypE [Pseudobutyrivibrio sp.]MBP5597428.1 hydrogenase expression/formation protein HypE [Pseudobutyrivibrio sp.]MBR5648978.1 hydrogenase expression/formation protein HypE [Pseudobutyrivibrio sp.]